MSRNLPLTVMAMISLVVLAARGCVSAPGGAPEQPRRDLTLAGDVVVSFASQTVTIPASVALDEGWLEVFACLQGTRDHETVVVTSAKPSTIHAALLLLELTPGSPALYDIPTKVGTPPAGPRIGVSLEWDRPDGAVEHLTSGDVLASDRNIAPPEFLFAGSLIAPNAPSMGPGEHYVADYTGTIVGLATFGDELIAARAVHSPETGVEPEAWRIQSGVLPPIGTPIRLVLHHVANGG